MKIIAKKFFLYLVCLLLVILILPNCARYKSRRLITPQTPIHKKQNIEIAKKDLTEKEGKYYFGGRNLFSRGYRPIHIYIKNNSNKTLYLNPNYINLPLEPSTTVARRMHRNVGWKVTKYFILGGPVWATVEWISSNYANKTINRDIREKGVRLDRAIKIRPYGVINKVLFVAKENYSSNFKLSLIEPKSNKHIDFNL